MKPITAARAAAGHRMPAEPDVRAPQGRALRAVAVFEAFKGLLVLATGFGLLSLLHKDVHELAASWIAHSHLNPASHLPRIFLDAATHINDGNLRLYALGAAGYAGVRLAEAYGLWRDRAWAEWLAALSGGLYLPIEVYELARHPHGTSAAVLVLNLLVVGLMVRALRQRKRRQERAANKPGLAEDRGAI